MQSTMNVLPLSFEDRYRHESRRTSYPLEQELLADLSAGGGGPLSRKQKHPLLSFDEVLDEDYELEYRQEDQDREEEEEEEEEEDTFPRRHLLTEEEYQREAVDYTRQQLKQSGLYYKHACHFWRLTSRDSFNRLKPQLVKFLLAFIVLAIPIVIGLFLVEDAPFAAKSDISMLPDLAQKAPNHFEESNRGRGSLITRLLRRAGLDAQRDNATELLVPVPLSAAPAESAKPAPPPVAEQPKKAKKPVVPEEETTNHHIGVYETPGLSFSSIIPSMQGMNIFSFAYSAAVDFFSRTFGWGPNETATGAAQ